MKLALKVYVLDLGLDGCCISSRSELSSSPVKGVQLGRNSTPGALQCLPLGTELSAHSLVDTITSGLPSFLPWTYSIYAFVVRK